MTQTKNGRPPWKHAIWDEVEPVVRHVIAVVILEGAVLVIGLFTRLLEYLFPDHKQYIEVIAIVDIWLALALLSLFGVFTLLLVGLRLFRSLHTEWTKFTH